MNLNDVLMSQNRILEHQCISAVDYEGYLYSKGFAVKKSRNTVSWNGMSFGMEMLTCLKRKSCFIVRYQENMVDEGKCHILSQCGFAVTSKQYVDKHSK